MNSSYSSFQLAVACWLAFGASFVGAEENSGHLAAGKVLFEAACAECHGEHGQGVADAYEEPLQGDMSLAELTQLISDTMPEGDPESCIGEEAEHVAAYVYANYYLKAAAAQPKIRLARLTADQLRQSLADLYQRHHDALRYTNEHGLKARYYNRDKKEDGDVHFDRVDAKVNFDFGHDGPGQGINKENFSIRWTGSLKPEETGTYELIVRCENSFLLYFGDYKRELINNYVQSAERTEFRESLFMTAGSIYPLAIELTQRKRKTEQPPVKISLSWKTPRGVEQVIPNRALINLYSQPTFSLQTKLPADDRSYGYERGIAVDEQWNSATTAAAIEFSDAVVTEAWPRYRRKHRDRPHDNREVLREYLTELVETAFRGPLDDSLRQRYIERHLDATENDLEVIRRVLLLAIKSPRFLYPLIDAERSRSQQAANRLALTLFDSLPVDQWLRDAATNHQLDSESQVRDAAWRMINDWRVRAKTRAMLHSWLNLDHFDDLSKTPELHPDYTDCLEGDLRASFDHFLDEVVWSDASDYRQLFLANWSFTTPAMAAFYGDAWQLDDPDAEFGRTSGNETNDATRAGVLTHPLMMSGLAYNDSSSPIHRGVYLFRYALGRTLRPPNEAFTPFSPDLHPSLTTRERVALQTGEKSCQVCHSKINALGFILENFDAVGRYQTKQLERAIDTRGSYTTTRGETIAFDGPIDLAEFLANDEDAHRAFINRAFQYFVKQPPAAFERDLEDRLLKSFQQTGYSIRKLIIEIAVAVAFQPAKESVVLNDQIEKSK